MRVSVCTIGFFLATCLSSATSAQSQDGTFYLQVCGAAVKLSDGVKLNQEDELGALYCGSYIGGFLDAMSLASTLSKGNKIVCTPERGITNDQAARIFVKHLRESPETLHQTGRMSLYVALVKAFPCAK